ncbi:homoserine dehydrogenase [Pseudogymnoascus sp. 24MN13]|nr:homoserine dehydrogenase [Pseudogymnoascus sp. 24MN13]
MAAQKTVFIGIIGVGGVGKCFLSQLKGVTERLAKNPRNPALAVVFMSRSKTNIYSADYAPLALDTSAETVAASKQDVLSTAKLIEYLAAAPGKAVVVDNTSAQDVADQYPEFLAKGVSVVTPNKKAFSGSSVGAGLPVISTVKDLVETGDEVTKIEGVFSGTMSFLFNSFAPTEGEGGKWAAEVKKAKELGYTEPDPRDDLNGLDVARKLTILARLVGLKIESPTSFPVQSLIPKELESCSSGEEFMQRLPEFDSQMEEVKLAAQAQGKVVRFVGSIDVAKGEVKVGLEMFDKSHPIAALKGSDNIISFYTKRYSASPLIVQGSGAGGEVTAMGVVGDLLKVVAQL